MKVADFGLARSVKAKTNGNTPALTDYVATRWYRAPEMLFGSLYYSKGVDMWSLGCILWEMMLGKPMFPGNSTINQIEKVLELIGRPSKEDLESLKAPNAATLLTTVPFNKTKNLRDLFPKINKDALDLIKNLLQFNPSKRLTVEQALRHPYLSQFHCSEEEVICKKVIEVPLDDHKYSMKEYRSRLYEDIRKKRKEQRKDYYSKHGIH